jgi:crotonobetainyl-CoA:carnitine CoA-transferase CaiB-like acyl-CoA transferase
MQHSKREIFYRCQEKGVMCAPLYSTKDMMEDSHFQARQFFVEVDHPIAGPLKYPGAPFKMSRSPFALCRPAPTLGQHNEEVLLGLLGYGGDDLVRLRERDII